MDAMRNDKTKGTEHAGCFAREARLRWLGWVKRQRKDGTENLQLEGCTRWSWPEVTPKGEFMEFRRLMYMIQMIWLNGGR